MADSHFPAGPVDLTSTIGGGVFVGRHQEMEDLKAALENSLSGQGRIAILAGQPGIGKTRTAQELTAYAAQKGVQVFWGRCYEEPGMPPYWPWVQVIRSYVRGRDPDQLRSQMGPGATDIAEVVPEVREHLPDLPPPPSVEPQQARFRLFDSIATFLMQASQAQPLILVLDNVHWADRSSLLLLEFLAQELADCRLMVVGTYRDTEPSRRGPLNHTLGELARHPRFSRVSLGGLSREEVGRFIQASAGFTPPQDLVEMVYTQTEGNPLFLTQVVQLLAQEGQLTPQAASEGQERQFQIPVGVREVIGRRVERLSESCNGVLVVASVVGREFGLDLLERLMAGPAAAFPTGTGRRLAFGLSSDDVLEAVEEALAARVIEEMPRAANRYQFTHVLIQNTLSQELSSARRVRLHARIGEALEELYAANLQAHAGELAYHFTQARPVLGPDKLVRYSLLAGERALAAYAWEEALEHFGRGLATKEGQAIDTETADLLFGLGRAQAATLPRHQIHEAVATLRQAFDYYVDTGDVEPAVAVATSPFPAVPGIPTGMGELISRTLGLVSPDSHEAARLLSAYVLFLGIEVGDHHSAGEAARQALTIAQRVEDAHLERRTLSNAAEVDYYHMHWEGLRDKSLRLVELARGADDPRTEMIAHYRAAITFYAVGDHQGAEPYIAASLALAERLRNRYWLTLVLSHSSAIAHAKGDWQSARTINDRGLAVEPTGPAHLRKQVALEYEVGNYARGEAYLERLLQAMELTPAGPNNHRASVAYVIPLVGRISGLSWRFDIAEGAAASVLSVDSATPRFAMLARAGLALLAVQRGDQDTARKQYFALVSQRGTMPPGSPTLSNDRLLGLLSSTMGNMDQAAEHFEDALTFSRKAGNLPELAWTCHDYAEALLQRSHSGDRARAVSLLDEALSISQELGMRPLRERVVALQEQLAAHPPRSPDYPSGLTQREVEVLRLIALGKSNLEIAEALVIAEGTARRHINNIYDKIGVSNRAEATRYAMTQGLIIA